MIFRVAGALALRSVGWTGLGPGEAETIHRIALDNARSILRSLRNGEIAV